MSEESPVPHERQAPEQVGPFAVVIADALAKLGRSQHKLAEIITDAAYDLDHTTTTVHPSAVNRWLIGTVARVDTRRWIAHALKEAGIDISREQIEAAAAAQNELRERRRGGVRAAQWSAAPAAGPGQPTPAPSAPPDSSVDSDDVKRRAFGWWMMSTGAAAATLDIERVTAILAGSRADDAALDDMETLTGDLVRREATLAPPALSPAVHGHLQGLRDLLVWTPSRLASRAHSLAGQTALLAGYLKFKQDRHADADAYYALAQHFGQVAGDTRLLAALLVLQAQRWEGENLPREGENHPLVISLLDRAMSLLGPEPDPVAAAHVLTFRSRAYAEARYADPAYSAHAMRDLDDLQRYLARIPSPDGSIYIVESVRGESIQKAGMALVHLGRPVDAAAQLGGLLTSIGHASLSWRAGIMANLAVAHAAKGEPDHASDLLSASLQLATQAAAPRAVNRVRHARRRWLAGHDSPAAQHLDEQLQTLALSPGASHPPVLPAL